MRSAVVFVYHTKNRPTTMNEVQPTGVIAATMDTHKKRQLYRVILKAMAWFGIVFVTLVLLRSCLA